jgi:hypothetical protein
LHSSTQKEAFSFKEEKIGSFHKKQESKMAKITPPKTGVL